VEGSLKTWARSASFNLSEQRRTEFNVYYHGTKTYGGKEIVLHIVLATLPEDPGYTHISVRSYDKKEGRGAMIPDVNTLEKQIGFNR
jgi:hypothetical protein